LKHLLLTVLLLLICMPGRAGWDSPADRYQHAWEQFSDDTCPIKPGRIRHFVYFARDREALRGHPLLGHAAFSGAQIMYPWTQLEPQRDRYDFSIIEVDLQLLQASGKQLFVQLQDATFDAQYRAVPQYLRTEQFDGGESEQLSDQGHPEGWGAKRWNAQVQARFAALLSALGQAFDGRIEGINLQESAIGVSARSDDSFTPALYAQALKTNMLALKRAFPVSVTMQYANFMPGEWLPWEDEDYLRSLYRFGEASGVGLGAPDLMVKRRGQLNHALAMMHEGSYTVPLGIAVQDGNYIGETNSGEHLAARSNLVPLLHGFARDFLRLDYMFWVNQAPYFEEDVLPCFAVGQD
jgi:hypothetical protein